MEDGKKDQSHGRGIRTTSTGKVYAGVGKIMNELHGMTKLSLNPLPKRVGGIFHSNHIISC